MNNTAIHDGALYIITDAGLTSGEQTAQVAHAVADFCLKHPEAAAVWHDTNEYMICLEAPSQTDLALLARQVRQELGEESVTVYREPDLNDAITAVALTPSASSRRLTANLPLAGRGNLAKIGALKIMEDLQELCPMLSFHKGETTIEIEGNNGGLYISVTPRRFEIAYLPYHTITVLPKDEWTDEQIITRKGRTTELLTAWAEMREEIERLLTRPVIHRSKLMAGQVVAIIHPDRVAEVAAAQ